MPSLAYRQNLEFVMYKQFFDSKDSRARTLSASFVRGRYERSLGTYTKTHADGWTISGAIHEDWFEWVNAFEATHPVFGRVWGDFEAWVYADSKEGMEAFCAAYPYEDWDYEDI